MATFAHINNRVNEARASCRGSGEVIVRLEHSCTGIQISSTRFSLFIVAGGSAPYLWGNRLRSNFSRGSAPAECGKCLFFWWGWILVWSCDDCSHKNVTEVYKYYGE